MKNDRTELIIRYECRADHYNIIFTILFRKWMGEIPVTNELKYGSAAELVRKC